MVELGGYNTSYLRVCGLIYNFTHLDVPLGVYVTTLVPSSPNSGKVSRSYLEVHLSCSDSSLRPPLPWPSHARFCFLFEKKFKIPKSASQVFVIVCYDWQERAHLVTPESKCIRHSLSVSCSEDSHSQFQASGEMDSTSHPQLQC